MGGEEEPFETSDGKRHPCYRPFAEVRECPSRSCALWSYREGHKPAVAKDAVTPLKAITLFCFDCLGGSGARVRLGGKNYTRSRPNRLIERCQLHRLPALHLQAQQ
jgi:hypothetical protein